MVQLQADVVVIGGGPSGSTVSTLIAQHGYNVILLERDHFPRYHIGESLIPETYWVLERLGVLPKLRASQFVKKHSVQFVSSNGRLSEPFYFADHKPHESSQTWQVLRQDFDHLLLNHARATDVDVREGVRVLDVIFEGERAVGVKAVDEEGTPLQIKAKVVVDAAGQSGIILDRLGLRQWDPQLKKAAIWTYWQGAYRDSGRDEGATMVLQLAEKKGWFWYIPLHNDVISVGVVADYSYLFMNRNNKNLKDIYFEEVERCPGLKPRIQNATQAEDFRAAKEYSYQSKKVAGDGWALVGDAFGFLDPLYSSGVLLALKSGALAADAIVEGLQRNDTSEQQLGKWGPDYIEGMNRMRQLVCEFYNGLNFGKLIRHYPDKKGLVTDVLIGDLFKTDLDELWPLIESVKE